MAKFEDLSKDEQKDIYINHLSGHEKSVEIMSILAIITTYRMNGETYLKHFEARTTSEIVERLEKGLEGLDYDTEDEAWKAIMATLEPITILDILDNTERYLEDYIKVTHLIESFRDSSYKEFSKEKEDILTFKASVNIRKIAEDMLKEHLNNFDDLGHIFDAFESMVADELNDLLKEKKATELEGRVLVQSNNNFETNITCSDCDNFVKQLKEYLSFTTKRKSTNLVCK